MYNSGNCINIQFNESQKASNTGKGKKYDYWIPIKV